MNNQLNVFTGTNSVLDFLNPDNNPATALVEIPQNLNPYYIYGVKIYAKLMNMTPLGNVKSLPALNMLLNLKDKKIDTLVENSSGNTVFSLAVIGRLIGIPTTKAVVSHEVTWGKLQLLRLLGTEPIINEEPICPDPEDKTSGIYKAKIAGQQKGWFNPGQYDNEENPKAHYKWTGPQIWEQTNGKVDIFVAGLGTTGTMFGAGGYLKSKNKNIVNVGVARLPNNPVPGVRTPNLLGQIAFNWKDVVDSVEEVGTVESFKKSLELCRYGLMVGPSSGFALQGLLNYLEKQKKADIKGKTCVFICCDSPLPYLSEYFEYLDESNFPAIQNEELLMNKPNGSNKKTVIPTTANFDIKVTDVFSKLYSDSKEKLWDKVRRNDEIELNGNTILLDVRTPEEYQDAHLPTSLNIDHTEALKEIDSIVNEAKGKTVYAICRSGRRSGLVVDALRDKKIKAFNVKGGMIEWSRLNYPRVQPEFCKPKLA